jgi:hypothetical protein
MPFRGRPWQGNESEFHDLELCQRPGSPLPNTEETGNEDKTDTPPDG